MLTPYTSVIFPTFKYTNNLNIFGSFCLIYTNQSLNIAFFTVDGQFSLFFEQIRTQSVVIRLAFKVKLTAVIIKAF